MRVQVIVHESFEISAAIEQWAIDRGHALCITRLYAGDQLPTSVDDMDYLIVMGGPHSPETTDCPHYDPKAEMQLILKAIAADRHVLGVCLGAQLIGQALGARFEHSPHKEIGVFDVTLTEAGKKHPLFSRFPAVFPVAHWHGDMPGLTKEAVVLAESQGCPRQIIQYGEKVYGFQCHFELTQAAVSKMILNCSHELVDDLPFVQSAEQLCQHDYDSINRQLFVFLDYIESTVALVTS